MNYQAIWIGGGAAGRFGSSYMKALGGKQLVIEKEDHLGGKCCKNACVLQHFLFDQTVELDQFRMFSGKMWYPKFEGRVDIVPIIKAFREGRELVYKLMNWQSKEQLSLEFILYKECKIVDPHTVEVEGKKFTTENLVIGTGARPYTPDLPGSDLERVLNYEGLANLDFEPKKVVVVGGGKIGSGYASFFNACGCDTTIIDQKPILTFLDQDIRHTAIDFMKKRGIKIYENALVKEIKGGPTVESVEAIVDGRKKDFVADTVFLATGVIPNSEMAKGINVKIGPMNEIVVNKRMQTNIPGVYAIGDVTGPPYEMYKARKSGMIAAKNIMGDKAELDIDFAPDFMLTTYEIAWAGLTEEEARKKYKNISIIRMPPAESPPFPVVLPMAERSMNFGHLKPGWSGLIKEIIDADSRKILGFHGIGFGIKDAFQYLAQFLKQGITIDELANMNELFLNPEHFIQLSRLRAGQKKLKSL